MSNKIFIPYYVSNANVDPASVLPRLFFYNGLKESDNYYIQYYNTFASGYQFEDYQSFPYFDNYSGQTTTSSSLSLLFLNEDPVYGTETPSQSLYTNYWSKYIDLLYNPRTRIIRLSAVLPFAVYNKLELNDVIQLRSNYYHLRAINDYNLRTGECRMELLGPLLEGSLDNTFTFDDTCEQAPTLYGSVINDTGSRQITFAITGSNCCNNPNYVVVKAQFGTGSCPQTASLTSYVTLPNSYPIVVNYASLLSGYPTVNCVTMSVANLCYGIPVTGSYLTFFTGALSGSYGNVAVSASTQRNNCGVCNTGSFYTTTVSAGTFTSTASQADANNQAIAYLTSVSQSNANTFGSCSINTFYNIQISGSITKNDCPTCQTGSSVLYTVPASSSMFTNTCSLSEANTSASIYFAATSQSYANTNGTCSINYYFNTATSSLVQRNNCGTCNTGSFVTYSLAASQSQFTSTCSFAEAQSNFIAYFNSTSQSYANTNGTCSINLKYSTAISASVQKNDCAFGPEYGTFINVSLPASYSVSSCSLAEAQTSAQNYFNSISQSTANTSGSCFTTQSVTFYFGQYMDITDTASLYPLTASIYRNTTTASMPLENDSKWTAFAFISGTFYTTTQSQQPQASTFLFVSGGYSGSNLYKVRGAGGQKIDTDSGDKVNWNGTSSVYMYYEFPKTTGTGVFPVIAVSKQLFGNISQSLSTNVNNYVGFSMANQALFPRPITASWIYSTSSIYPSFSEAGWSLLGFMSGSGSGFNGLNVVGIQQSGSIVSASVQNPNGSLWATGSGYLYFKLQSGSLQISATSASYTDSASFSQLTTTASVSGGIVRVEYNVFSSSMENSSRLNLG